MIKLQTKSLYSLTYVKEEEAGSNKITVCEQPWLWGYHPSSPVNSLLVLTADTIRESELPFPSHQEEPSLSLGHGSTQVCAFMHLFCQAPSRRLSLSCVLHLLLLQVNSGKWGKGSCLELGHLLSAAVLFSSFCKWLFESNEKGRISTVLLTGILGLQGNCNGAIVELWSPLAAPHPHPLLGWFWGSLLLNKGRGPGDGKWEFLSYWEHPQHLIDMIRARLRIKVFILQYPLCFFCCLILFSISKSKPVGTVGGFSGSFLGKMHPL